MARDQLVRARLPTARSMAALLLVANLLLGSVLSRAPGAARAGVALHYTADYPTFGLWPSLDRRSVHYLSLLSIALGPCPLLSLPTHLIRLLQQLPANGRRI